MKNQLKTIVYLLIINVPLVFSTACKRDQAVEIQTKIDTVQEQQTNYDHLIMSVLWFQRAAENRALYYQAFNWAKMIVKDKMKHVALEQLPAVVFDIDETLLDNSPFESECIKKSKGYTKEFWLNWTSMENANALPGTVDFIKFLDSLGVEVIYISNRLEEELDVTMENMEKIGFPSVKKENFLLKSDESSKEERRLLIQGKYNVILYVGDNLADYKKIFEACDSETSRSELVDQHKSELGTEFILLPNPMYGDWEKELYNCKHGLSDAQKDSLRRTALNGF